MRKLGASLFVALAGMLTGAQGVMAATAVVAPMRYSAVSAEQGLLSSCRTKTKTVYKIVKEQVQVQVVRDATKEVQVTTYKMVPKTVYKDAGDLSGRREDHLQKVNKTCYKDSNYTVTSRCTRPASRRSNTKCASLCRKPATRNAPTPSASRSKRRATRNAEYTILQAGPRDDHEGVPLHRLQAGYRDLHEGSEVYRLLPQDRLQGLHEGTHQGCVKEYLPPKRMAASEVLGNNANGGWRELWQQWHLDLPQAWSAE